MQRGITDNPRHALSFFAPLSFLRSVSFLRSNGGGRVFLHPSPPPPQKTDWEGGSFEVTTMGVEQHGYIPCQSFDAANAPMMPVGGRNEEADFYALAELVAPLPVRRSCRVAPLRRTFLIGRVDWSRTGKTGGTGTYNTSPDRRGPIANRKASPVNAIVEQSGGRAFQA